MVTIAFLAALFLFAVWPWLPLPGRGARPRIIVFYGFSILGEVMTQSVFPAFKREWYERTGERVEFISAFAGSGTITNQLIMGVPGDLALLSLELDAQRLSEAGVIAPLSWHSLPHRGVLNRTPFIILVRPGNPKDIRDFADLARPGVEVVHPDPMTSGGANWAIVAEYGAGLRSAPDQPLAGYNLLLGIWRNVVAQAASARAARTQFENGFGDALITYEQEALWDQVQGKLHAEIIYPQSTILSEHTLVVVERNIPAEERDLIDAFVAFLWTETAQTLFVERGFRSVDDRLNEANPSFGRIQSPFLIDEFGGWAQAKHEIIDGIWKNRVLKELGR
jgi:sulfate transport system substrate-binding protein